ncbi:MAG TPA: hypothetical protein PKM76_04550 [Bacteroidales bacterium]|nr:hypothetical protein [Bacteroidales bacterium]
MKHLGYIIFYSICIICSCKSENRIGVINEFVIGFSEEPNCAYLGFKITSNDIELKKAVGEKHNIEIKGSFFNDSLFSMSDPKIRSLDGDTIIITSRSCYFNDKSQIEVDSIAENALKEISITISQDNREWLFKKK